VVCNAVGTTGEVEEKNSAEWQGRALGYLPRSSRRMVMCLEGFKVHGYNATWMQSCTEPSHVEPVIDNSFDKAARFK